MAESEEEEGGSEEFECMESEQKNPNADNDNNRNSFIFVVDDNTQQAMRLRNEPKKYTIPLDIEQRHPTESNQKTDDEDVELKIPPLTNATAPSGPRPKLVVSVLNDAGLRFASAKRPREPNEKMDSQIVIQKASRPIVVKDESTSKITPSAQPTTANNADIMVSSTEKIDSNNEETYFALSLVGILKRLTPHKRAIAKCHILSYLTELEYGSSELILPN